MRASKNKAFSLIELAIAGLIISILLAGVLQGSTLVKKAKLANARALTAASPVASMEGLMVWYESTSKKSFDAIEAMDGQTISTWYDLNPNVETIKNNATQITDLKKPVYKENEINGLPAIVFTSVNETEIALTDGNGIVNSGYTIFIVGQRKSTDPNYFLGGTSTNYNTNLHIGYDTNTTVRVAQFGNGFDLTVDGYTQPKPIILTTGFNFITKDLFLNGGSAAFGLRGVVQDVTQGLTSYPGPRLGAHVGSYLEGSIAEVIIFKRYLKTLEREAIERYLSEKWDIALSY